MKNFEIVLSVERVDEISHAISQAHKDGADVDLVMLYCEGDPKSIRLKINRIDIVGTCVQEYSTTILGK